MSARNHARALATLAALLLGGAARGDGGAGATPASPRPRLGMRVAIDVEQGTARGHLVAEIANPTGAPLDHLELWRFPARLARRSRALAEHSFFWVYPHHFDPGAMDVSEATVDGRAVTPRIEDGGLAGLGTLIVIPLPVPLAPGARARLEIGFATRVPYRLGAFGCYRRTCTLAGGFYPMPVQLGAGGYDRTAPPARADIDLVVETAAPALLVDGLPVRSGEAARIVDAAWAVVVAGRAFRSESFEYRGVRVVQHHRGGRPPAALDGNRFLRSRRAIEDALDMLAELGLELPVGHEVRLVEAPLRMELSSPQAHLVLISDEVYRLPPLRRFVKFHAFQVVAAVMESILEARLAARERPADLAFAPAVGASWLVDLFTVRVYQRKESARDILKWITFIPAIDRLVSAPQVPFTSAYFNSLDDPDPTRDDLRRFASDWPRGKVIHEKMRDLLGDVGLTELLRRQWQGEPLREAAEAIHGAPLDWFFRQWLAPFPAVDYRYQITGHERSGGGHRYHLRLYKRGPAPPVEPVEIELIEWGGERHRHRWDGRGAEERFTVETRRRVRAVRLDPHGRLQENIPGENVLHRLDDWRPAQVKFIWNNFGALFDFQTLRPELSVDFTFQGVYDLKNAMRLVVYTSNTTDIGGLLGYTRGFGRKILPSRLSSAWTTTARVARLNPHFAETLSQPGVEAPAPAFGTRVTVASGLTYDDRRYIFEPWNHTLAAASVAWSLTMLDDGRRFQQVTAAAALSHGFTITPAHSVSLEVAGAATFGDLRLPSQALFVGGGTGPLRGYRVDEVLGRGFASLRVEYRHLFLHDLGVNLLYLAYLRGVGGGLFAEGALVVPCDGVLTVDGDASHDARRNLFGDVGYSLRLLGDFLGVAQTMFNIDVAVPLVRRARECLGTTSPPEKLPLAFYVYFGTAW